MAIGPRIAMGVIALWMSGCNPTAESHINANIPEAQEFDSVLKRDLAKHFEKSTHSNVLVEYELLRNGPTQSGIAYPKYYAWVRVTENKKQIEEGAMRLRAIEKVRFDVTDFVSKKEIRANPAGIEEVFPRVLCDNIRARAEVQR